MSSLLEKAIIDARALKDAALKSAENLVVEKYSQEIKETMNKLLNEEEMDPMAADPMATAPMAADPMAADPMAADPMAGTAPTADPMQQTGQQGQPQDLPPEQQFLKDIPDAFDVGEDEQRLIRINLDDLEAQYDTISSDAEEDELDQMVHPDGDDEIEIGIQDLELGSEAPSYSAGEPVAASSGDLGAEISSLESDLAALEEDIDISMIFEEDDEITEEESETNEGEKENGREVLTDEEDLVSEIEAAVEEALKIDMKNVGRGWAGVTEEEHEEATRITLARENDDEVKKENEALRDRVKELTKENKILGSAALKLQNQSKKHNDTITSLHEKLEQSNVANAKLLYINQTLENTSLNERQKRKIVEAISKADTVNEARMLYETLQETVVRNTDHQRGPNSLTEAVTNRSSLLLSAGRQQEKTNSNPLYSRLQTLAGIKT